MRISDLIKILEKFKETRGDIGICITINGSFQRYSIESVRDRSLIHPGRIVIDVDIENYRL